VIRDLEERDAEAASALIAEHSPWFSTPAGVLHRVRSVPERARRGTWVAERERHVVGFAEAEFEWTTDQDDVGGLWLVVHPDLRRRGIGSALYERAVQHLASHGARELRTWAGDDGAEFVEHRGFVASRHERISAVDPRSVDTARTRDLPDGVRVVPLSALLDRLPEVHALYAEASADMPADHAESNLPLEEWLEERIGDPNLDRDASIVVLVDDHPAALSWVYVDERHARADHDLTGTARRFRRRGLARLAKLAVIERSAARGVTTLTTENDSENVGMLAINDELGFRPYAVVTEWVKQLG
jgi:GNAT superfamily N-acetyltransferase